MTGAVAAADLAARRRLLVATLAAARVDPAGERPAVLAACRRWLDRWAGVGAVAAGMARQGYDLQLARYGEEGWRATFFPAGRAHSVVAGSAWAGTPWHAVQAAAWEALGREAGEPSARGGASNR